MLPRHRLAGRAGEKFENLLRRKKPTYGGSPGSSDVFRPSKTNRYSNRLRIIGHFQTWTRGSSEDFPKEESGNDHLVVVVVVVAVVVFAAIFSILILFSGLTAQTSAFVTLPLLVSKVNMNAKFDAAVTAMTLPENRFDVTIICTTDDHQAAFWMSKLSAALLAPSTTDTTTNDNTTPQFPLVLAVSEDWTNASGAGNGLGTLYAWKKACEYAETKYANLDLTQLLLDGKISAALYHTAGKGTRMAPLPASENNNKPGVVSKEDYSYVQ
jgi:hypothetical protein